MNKKYFCELAIAGKEKNRTNKMKRMDEIYVILKIRIIKFSLPFLYINPPDTGSVYS